MCDVSDIWNMFGHRPCPNVLIWPSKTDLIQIHELADLCWELLLGGNLRALVGTQNLIDPTARSGIEDGQLLSHKARHKSIEREIGVLGGQEVAVVLVVFSAFVLGCALGRG